MNNVTLTYRYNKEGNQYNVICLDWRNLVYTCADSLKECYPHAIEATQLAIEAYNNKELIGAQMPRFRKRTTLNENEFQITFDFYTAQPMDMRFGQRIKYNRKLTKSLNPISVTSVH